MAEVMLNGTEIATDDVRRQLMTQPEGSAMHRLLNLGPCPPNEPTNERLLRIVLASQGMSEVYRVPRSLDGKREDDLQHCVRLAMTCYEIMKTPGYDHLDQAKVLSMALNHEWPEALAGDVPTYAISSDAYAHKKAIEAVAADIMAQLLPEGARRDFLDYEKGNSPEARFVCAVDKLMPLLLDIHGQGSRVLREDYNVKTIEQFDADARATQLKYEKRFGAEFPELAIIHEELNAAFREQFYDAISTVERTFTVDPVHILQRFEPLERDPSFWRRRHGFITLGNLGLRATMFQNGNTHHELLTKKTTTKIDAVEFAELWGQTEGKRVISRGATVPFTDENAQPHHAEVAIYQGDLEGLTTVAVSYVDRPDRDPSTPAFTQPRWFGAEITGNTAYTPEKLAGNHFSQLSTSALNGYTLARR